MKFLLFDNLVRYSQIISAKRLVYPSTEVGLAALSVDIKIKLELFLIELLQTFSVPKMLFLTAGTKSFSKIFKSFINCCVYY